MDNFRVWYNADRGWIIDTKFGLTSHAISAIMARVIVTQKQRLAGLMPGPLRDECKRTIVDAATGRVSINIAGAGTRVLYDAYKSDKVFVGGPLTS